MIALSEAQGFPFWLGVGRAFHAAARVVAGDLGALPEILDGMALAGETGSQAGAPALFALLAEAQQAAGQLAEAQGTSRAEVFAQCGERATDLGSARSIVRLPSVRMARFNAKAPDFR
mgnify:CR=1 FL=1